MTRSLDAARASAPVELSCPPLLPGDFIYADLMTTFSAAGRARHSRLFAASRARREDVRMAFGAIWVGPDRLPIEAFSGQLHESLLA
jgi:hypothetical protein